MRFVIIIAFIITAVNAKTVSKVLNREHSGLLHEVFTDRTVSKLPLITAVHTSNGWKILSKPTACEHKQGNVTVCLVNNNGKTLYAHRVRQVGINDKRTKRAPEPVCKVKLTSKSCASICKHQNGSCKKACLNKKLCSRPQKPKPVSKSIPTPAPTPTPTPTPVSAQCSAPSTFDVCCNNDASLQTTPKSYVDNVYPYTSVVLIVSNLIFSDGNTGQGACTGTLISDNVILTAGHCITETDSNGVTSLMTAATVYFNVYDSNNDGPAIVAKSYAYWNDWAKFNVNQADQALLLLAQSPGYQAVQTVDYLNTGRDSGPLSLMSVGFPHFAETPFSTFNNKYSLNSGSCLNPVSNPFNNIVPYGKVYYLQLLIGQGMSGGPVFDTSTNVLIATNDFEPIWSDCGKDMSCYNGYTPIDNVNYPLKSLFSTLSPTT